MTLSELVDVWTVRHELSWKERTLLAEALYRFVDYPLMKHGPMPSEMAEKLGMRTFELATRKLLEERLSDEHFKSNPIEQPPPVSPRVDTKPIERAPESAVKRRRGTRHCSVCNQPGHDVRFHHAD